MVLAQDPEHLFADLVVKLITQLFFEPLELLFAQRIKAISIVLGHMETVDHDLTSDIVVILKKISGCLKVAIPYVGCNVFDSLA